MSAMQNERGIALVLTLLVVALLTIIVIEFTYSVEIDQHMARNALNSLQASLLARSGVNLGEAFLLHDDDPTVDSYLEDWGQLDQLNSQLVVPDNMRLRVQIIDEGGKFNMNLTRPRNAGEWLAARQPPPQGANAAPRLKPFQMWNQALARLLQGRGVDPQVADGVNDYWDNVFALSIGQLPAGPAGSGSVSGTPTPVNPNASAPDPRLFMVDFPSLDDASVIPGFTAAAVRKVRPVLTALDSSRQPQINVNTAPRLVLNAVIDDDGVVGDIINRRQEQPLKPADLGTLLTRLNGSNPNPNTAYVRQMLGFRSSYFLIRASAVINPNPTTGKGGIARSASMLVMRVPNQGIGGRPPSSTSRWTLTQLDWQKEGGAALFDQKGDQLFQQKGTHMPHQGGDQEPDEDDDVDLD
jgi:general secretion pathway protein K